MCCQVPDPHNKTMTVLDVWRQRVLDDRSPGLPWYGLLLLLLLQCWGPTVKLDYSGTYNGGLQQIHLGDGLSFTAG